MPLNEHEQAVFDSYEQEFADYDSNRVIRVPLESGIPESMADLVTDFAIARNRGLLTKEQEPTILRRFTQIIEGPEEPDEAIAELSFESHSDGSTWLVLRNDEEEEDDD